MAQRKILVVDDEEDLTSLIEALLKRHGDWDVCVANDGKEAMALVVSFEPDIVLLDFVMPEAKGDEVLEYIKKHCDVKNMSIVLMSGLGEMVYFKKNDAWKWLPNTNVVRERGDLPGALKWKRSPEEISQEFGVAAFLPKPFSQEILLDVLRELGEEVR